MPPPVVAVLVNSLAGRGRGARAGHAVTVALTAEGLTPRLLTANDRADAERRAVTAVREGVAAVAALGGDGAADVLRGRQVGLAGSGLSTCADGEPVCALPAVSVCVPGALRVVGTGWT